MMSGRMDWKSKRVEALLEQALVEDQALKDITTSYTIDPKLRATGTILAKEDCVVSGLGCIPRFLDIYARLSHAAGQSDVVRSEVVHHPEIFDGVRVKRGQSIAVVRSTARVLLSCERVILNLMQRMSGIASITRSYVDQVQGTKARVLDTRKTVPGLRLLDKYAVSCGGGENHRLDLSDGILIKNNHIALGGGIPKVVEAALAARQPGQRVQVEVRNREELEQAIMAGAEAILLDNMSPAEVAASVELIRSRGLTIPIEASGGIQIDTIRSYAEAGVDYISSGALTHSAIATDLSMRIVAEP
jgi:nicotinate-nucleotide pyrophosphorylase (carboxylating)